MNNANERVIDQVFHTQITQRRYIVDSNAHTL